MSEQTQLSPAQLVNQIRSSYGMTWDEMGAAMGRSGRMMRKIAREETSGESYRAALTELHESGRIEHRPPRRRGKGGELVKVRAKRGTGSTTVTPADLPATPAAQDGAELDRDDARAPGAPSEGSRRSRSPRRQFSSETTYLPDGNRIHTIEMPKTQGARGREEGVKELRRKIVNVARGTKHKDKRVRLEATVDIGGGRTRRVTVGDKAGYLANDVVSDVRDRAGGDMTAWLRGQMGNRYVEELGSQARVVSVTMTTFNATRSKSERVAQDEAGSRRWNRKWTGSRWT
ncbi:MULTISPECIES: hypothetical protein [Bacteria]|uniref:hypothetical protein n=1 Tax=Bacteria TaxID=2 RepID=UPI0006660C1E|nr:hypothetical protein [Micrococcus luteus]TPJ36638.1 hypothetical protein FJ437_32515 [Mesorhizobium sp. B2-6-6]MBN6750194.1 hypothetical protein [Micrococcus luteus]MBN6760594.1 hypothetical protein [Micrococcus luteus]MBN6801825.1 hypothetical protein [Micrococcus luteus]MCV7576776.1 hypothetical protein [Micrococcus luteus]